MNTVASQITVYTDSETRIRGPIEPGPTLYEWAAALADRGDARYDDQTLAEARDLGPNSYPSRAFYGAYLCDCFNSVVANAPRNVRIQLHRTRAVETIDSTGLPGGPQAVVLANGATLSGLDAVILAQGHVPTRPTAHEERTAALARAHRLTYIGPANPADLDLSGIPRGRNVLLRGLGLNFFDHMALFTVGRGGSFAQRDERLVYHPSGDEPMLYATSRRGVPYHARGENEKGVDGRYAPRLLTGDYIEQLRGRAAAGESIRFCTHLWPLIAREVESVYYGTLLEARGRSAEREAFVAEYLSIGQESQKSLLQSYRIDAADHWDWLTLSRPYEGLEFRDRADFRAWLLAYLAKDVLAAKAGNLSGPVKAALDILRDLRNEIRLAVDHAGLDGRSHRDELDGWYTPLNAFLSIGPPVSRIEEMIALIEAGVLELTGPGTEIRIDTATPSFVAASSQVPGPLVRAGVLIEARIPEPDLRRTADPLLQHLIHTRQAKAFRIPAARGSAYETGGLAVTERPYRLLDAQGHAHPRRFAYGVPTESVHWVTAAGIRPGVDSVTLGDSDAIARSVLAMPPACSPQAEPTCFGVIV